MSALAEILYAEKLRLDEDEVTLNKIRGPQKKLSLLVRK